MATPSDDRDWKSVDTRGDFVAYLRLLAASFEEDEREYARRAAQGEYNPEGRWAHGSVPAVLDAWASWLTDTPDQSVTVAPLTWRSLAEQLYAASIYE